MDSEGKIPPAISPIYIPMPNLKTIKARQKFLNWAVKNGYQIDLHSNMYDQFGFRPFIDCDTQDAWSGWYGALNQNGELNG